jgi:hypothetical protein
MMANIVNFIENDGRTVLFDYSTEIIHVDWFLDKYQKLLHNVCKYIRI